MQDTREIEVLPIFYDNILTKDYDVNILVGGRASGKTYFIEQLASFNLNNCKNYKFLVVEDVETNIGAGVKDGLLNRIDDLGQSNIYSSTKQPAEIRNKINDNTVIFKGYHSDKQQKQVKSLNEVTACFYEEAENITYQQFKSLRMQLRGGEAKDRKLYLALNPISSDSFINNYFFRQMPDKVLERFADGRPKVFEKDIKVDIEKDGEFKEITISCIITISTYHDNKFLTDEQRADIEDLKNTNIDLYKMLAEGRFVKPQGAFFKEFNKDIHVVKPFKIPAHWDRYLSIDYGLDMLACIWYTIDTHGKTYIYREYNQSDLIISEAAEKIKQFEKGENIKIHYAPSDLWNRRQETGKSAWDIFAENGVILIESDRNRINGSYAIKEWLKVYDSRDIQTGEAIKTSDIKIWDNCTTLINNLEVIQTDEKDANIYETKKHHELSHNVDALRYYCIMRTSPSAEKKEKKMETHLPRALRSIEVSKSNELAGAGGGFSW